MFRNKAIIIILILFFLPTPLDASESGVVINSFRISGQSSTDEYIEIYNRSERDINLFGWRLAKKTASGNTSNLLTSFPEIFIEPDSSLIIGHSNCTCSLDLSYSTSGSVAADNTIILFSDNGKTVVDKVGFGNAVDFELYPTNNPLEFEVYGRKNNGFDSDNNKADFFLLYAPPKPKEEQKPASVSRPSEKNTSKDNFDAKLIVTEFLPNPEGPDSENEFIEIKNIGPAADIGGYYIADTIGSPKGYKIPEGTSIGQNQYLAFYSAKTPISLNNKGDGVEVWDPEKNVINASPDDCGKAPEGMSYALGEKGWSWTKTPTPGKPNVITAPSESEVLGKSTEKESIEVIDDSEFEKENIERQNYLNNNDRIFGTLLLIVAIIGTISYTLYANKENLIEFYYKFRKRDNRTGEEIRQKIKRG